jgi:nicotinate-nucleotide adenylyltransferase
MLKIALFGTSADPPTAGHELIIRWLSERYDWVAVWAADNPMKSQQTPLVHRQAMLKLLVADIVAPRQNIGFNQELSSWRTIETLEKAQAHWGESAFTLVVGADLIGQLPRWYRVEDLLRQVELLVVPRPGYEIDEANLEIIRQLGGKIAIASLTGLNVSSTKYRQQGDSHILTAPVEAYIHRENLYKCEDAAVKKLPIWSYHL